jgi:hypothetical protein
MQIRPPATAMAWRGALFAPVLAAGLWLGVALPASAALVNSPALPVSELITVQPIIVCDNTGVNCANSASLRAYETMANVIYNQAGIGVAFAAPTFYANSAYLVPQVDTTINGLFDTAHDLLRLTGHGQSTNPNTLNVYLVNTIASVTTTASNTLQFNTAIHSYGYGFIGGNGAIIATTPDSLGRVAAADTLGHEIGHNLGLPHSDSAPVQAYNSAYNLMNTGSRIVATDPCQITPYTCAVAEPVRDQLASVQTATLIAPPILTELPHVTGSVDALPGAHTVGISFENISVSPPVNSPLNKIKFRFTDPTTQSAPGASTIPTRIPIGNHVELDYATGSFSSGTLSFGLSSSAPLLPAAYSSEYDFANGATSRAGFDMTGLQRGRSSNLGAVFTFDPSAPDVLTGPSYLPTDPGVISPLTGQPVGIETDSAFTTPDVLQSIPLPFAELDAVAVAVPEPGSFLVVGSALAYMGLRRRRKA